NRHTCIHQAFFLPLFAIFILLAGIVSASSAAAQTTPDPAPAQQDPSYAALADLLENDKARDKLIEQLRSLAPEGGQDTAAGSAAPATAPGTADQDATNQSLPQQLAQGLQTFTAGIQRDTAATMAAVRAAIRGEPVPGSHLHASLPGLRILLFTILGTLLAYIVFRSLAQFGFARLNNWILNDKKDKATPATPAADMAPAVKRYRYASLTFSRKLLGVLAAFLIDVAAS